jgi:hypothetical protein
MSKGYKSTEFWLSLAAVLVGALLASGAIESDGALKLLGMASSILATLGYTGARAMTKTAEAKAIASVESTRIAAGPQSPQA